MAWFRGTGRARPSKAMSWLAAVVGIGMVSCVVLFFVAPLIAGIAFVGLWVLTVAGIIAYHIRNATSEHGVAHAHVSFEAETSGDRGQSDFDERLRDLERLRQDGLLTEEEYRRKRADVLNEDW